MATSMGSHAGNVLPGMESTPVQRTIDSSFVGQHYANLGASTAKWSKEQLEQGRIFRLVEEEKAARASGGEWKVKMSKKDKEQVDRIIQEDEERKRYWKSMCKRMYDEDYDDYDDQDCCRNCGANDVSIFGCCSMRCAKDADEYD